MAKLITELSYDFEVVEEKKNNEMFAVGIFSSAELLNNNKRRYRKEILEREVSKIDEKVNKKSLWGELGHPPNPEINPDKIAIRTMKLEWKGNDLYGKAKILDTPMGNIARTLIKEGSMGISSRGLGTVGDDGYVNEDFNLITWDLVTDPSNNPSWVNGIYEGKEFDFSNGEIVSERTTEEEIRQAQEYYTEQILEMLDTVEGDIAINEIFGIGGKKVVADPEQLMKSAYTSLRSAYRSGDPETFFTILDDMIRGRKSYLNAIKQYKKMTGRELVGSTKGSGAQPYKRKYTKRS
jgi:hypothetical protein